VPQAAEAFDPGCVGLPGGFKAYERQPRLPSTRVMLPPDEIDQVAFRWKESSLTRKEIAWRSTAWASERKATWIAGAAQARVPHVAGNNSQIVGLRKPSRASELRPSAVCHMSNTGTPIAMSRARFNTDSASPSSMPTPNNGTSRA
jgi:hypothetical protein